MPAKGPSTKNLVDIADIRDTLVILKNGSLRSVVEVSSVNFELKGEEEKRAIVSGFQDFLNAIDFPLQIVISSRKLNLVQYIVSVQEVTQNLDNELLKIQANEYVNFIKGMAELSNIVSKKFYVVVPFFISEASGNGGSLGIGAKLRGLFSSSAIVKSLDDTGLEKYTGQMEQRIAVIGSTLSGLGLSVRTLGYDELLNLFYGYYNPGQLSSASQAGPLQ